MTAETCETGTNISTNSISTSTVLTRLRGTVVDIVLTICSIESIQARTVIRIGLVIACATILTRIRRTLVDICLTCVTSETGITSTHKAVDQVRTITVVRAVIAVSAFIDVDLAACTIEAREAITRIVGDSIDTCTILAGIVKTLVDVNVTVWSSEASVTATVICSIKVVASTINTGVEVSGASRIGGGTLINIELTVGSIPSSSAGTVIEANKVITNAGILTWIRLTLVDWILTTIPSPAICTGTVEVSYV